MMNLPQIEHLCEQCGLGIPLTEPQPVPGGLLHYVWRVTTTQGLFAVKELNPAIIGKADLFDEYRLTERIASAMAEHGIPAVAAHQYNGDVLQMFDKRTFMFYDWMEGEILATDPVEPAHALLIGSLLGRIHMLQLQYPELSGLKWKHFHEEDWDVLTFQASDREIPWANAVRAALPRLLEWGRWYEAVGDVLSQTLVVSHRDLDQKNVIWLDAQTPRIIDWEAVGLINPTVELASTALSWSGYTGGVPREDTFNAVIEGYLQAGGVVHDSGMFALHGLLGTWLGWLLFNMRRSLGEAAANEDERLLGIQETKHTLLILRSLAEHLETWAAWLDKWR